MKRSCFLVFIICCLVKAPVFAQTMQLANKKINLTWSQTAEGWKITHLQCRTAQGWKALPNPSGEYTLLFTAEKPATGPQEIFSTITGKVWPDTTYKYQINNWKQATAPVALNTAGEAVHGFPKQALQKKGAITFTSETDYATIITEWKLDPKYPTDILVTQTLLCKKDGYYSAASPSLNATAENDLAWATVPGYFQGNAVEHNLILAYGYGHGIPDKPVIYRERCASTFCPIITNKQGITYSVIPAPGLGRDPWSYDRNTHQDWFLGISHRNRKAELTPTMYYPVLGEPSSQHKSKDTITFSFRYSITDKNWYQLITHVVNDVYSFNKALALRKNTQSLSNRIEKMHDYLLDKQTSLWNIEDFNGLTIGGQSYLGGVVGSQRDAQKNSDYGAMWMLSQATGDPYLKDSVLPYALNFKLAQQQTTPGFFKGAAIGQYYLAKRKMFTEEWGDFVEPISLTYYIMLDIGNILLFEPNHKALRERLTLGAELLLQWQKPDGSWEVAYDRHTHAPLFTDIKDLRPTFYGLLVAYRILKEPKYLAAARKGADWFLTNAVDKGAFIGVCGDARYAPDFATAQSAQALLDLYDLTGDKRYQQAAIQCARIYCMSIYTQPVADTATKFINGTPREDWQIAQSGLSFEHGGILGSANGGGPILLCSHAGLFVRMFGLTKDSLFIEMARAAAIGRDAFVDSKTSVASYYWNAMNKGAGPYPHHAWWQIGWITDYLLSEAQMRAAGQIVFPRGFVTPKVGPHQSYGFAPGKIYGQPAKLLVREGLVASSDPNIEYVLAESTDGKKLFVILLNDIGETVTASISVNGELWKQGQKTVPSITDRATGQQLQPTQLAKTSLKGYGIKILVVQ